MSSTIGLHLGTTNSFSVRSAVEFSRKKTHTHSSLLFTSLYPMPAQVCVFDGTYYKMMLNDVGVPVTSFCKISFPVKHLMLYYASFCKISFPVKHLMLYYASFCKIAFPVKHLMLYYASFCNISFPVKHLMPYYAESGHSRHLIA